MPSAGFLVVVSVRHFRTAISDLAAERPKQLWGADLTYVPTWR